MNTIEQNKLLVEALEVAVKAMGDMAQAGQQMHNSMLKISEILQRVKSDTLSGQ